MGHRLISHRLMGHRLIIQAVLKDEVWTHFGSQIKQKLAIAIRHVFICLFTRFQYFHCLAVSNTGLYRQLDTLPQPTTSNMSVCSICLSVYRVNHVYVAPEYEHVRCENQSMYALIYGLTLCRDSCVCFNALLSLLPTSHFRILSRLSLRDFLLCYFIQVGEFILIGC